MARVKTEMQELEHPGVAAPEPGTRLVHNGENYAVTSISPDGVVIMREGEEGNNSLPEVISLDTYYAEKQAEIDAQEQEQEQQPQSGENGEAAQEVAPPAEEEPAPVTGGEAVQDETALGRIPKDEQGQPLYEQADAETAWDAIMEQAGGDEAVAQEVANDIVSEQEKALKAAEKELKKVQDGKLQQRKGDAPLTVEARIAAKQAVREQTSRAQAGVDEARKRLEAWRTIAETPQRRRQAIEAERRQEEKEAARLRGIQEEQERAEREEAERIRREALQGVPDFIEDRPQDARARGYRRVNGNRVDRQEPIQARRGGEVQVKFDDNNIPTGHTALIEASQLQPSHTDGMRNPRHFIDEAQPKERNDEASVMSARKIAANIRPEEITSSVTAYTGAPTVNSRGEVIQGNNRSAALREMWAEHPEQAAKYRQYLADHAADFGLTPEDVKAMQQPVLVNMLEVTDDAAITLGQFVAQDTESGGTERIKPKNMVQKMGDDMRIFAGKLLASADEEMSFAELVDRNGADVQGNADENIRRAESEVERNPSEAQKEAGNYRKGHVRVDGYDITIEQPKGSVRSGTDANGKRWENVMNNTYGYMRGTEGVDGDHIDVFLSDNPESGNVYVVDQRDPKTGEFDEHKVMYGFGSMEEARDAYLKNYTPGWQGLGTITEVSKDEFRKWIGSSKRKTKPFAEYKSVKKEAGQNEDVRQSRDGGSPLSAEEAAIRDAIVERLRESGIEVITDAEAGQRVLDEANGKGEPVRTQAMIDGLKKASDFILSALGGKTKQRKARIEIPERANRLAEEAIGHPIKSHAININELVHIKKRHGKNGTANDANSIPLRDEDIALMPYIMSAPTRVIKGSMAVNGTESVRYEKDLDNGVVVVVEREGRFDVEDMENITMWAKKKPATNVTVAEKASHSTSETIVISETDSAKIRKDAEDAIHGDEKVREHRVYHGSGADFEAFDHSHMGEGEGAQAYGWGSYVTEVEGIGRTYAENNTGKGYAKRINSLALHIDSKKDFIKARKADIRKNEDYEKYAKVIRKNLRDSQKDYKAAERVGNEKDMKFYQSLINISEQQLTPEYHKNLIDSFWNDINDAQSDIDRSKAEMSGLKKELKKMKRHLYTVEIPDDTGENYLEWDKPIPDRIDREQLWDFTLGAVLSKEEHDETEREMLSSDIRDSIDDAETGKDLYKAIELYIGDREASSLLHDMGFTGISYPAQATTGGRKDGARNYVIFDEKDLQITDHVRFFRTPGGEAYGFTAGGKIYIDPRTATADTPIHEYAHLWAGALRQANPKEWQNITELMKGTPAWDEVKRLYPELESDEEIADEALAMYSGRRGAERLREATERAWNESADLGVKAAAARAMGRVRDALRRFWQAVADLLHFRYTSAEEVADRVMRDLMEGVNPNSRAEEDANRRFNERLDELIANPNQKDRVLHLGRAGKFLRDGKIEDAEIELEYDKLVRKSNEGYKHEHPFDAADIHDLPVAINAPIAVFADTNGKDNAKVILTELKKNGRNFIVAVRAEKRNRKGGVVLTINEITTLFPKDARGIVNWINQNKATNIDKEKALDWIEALRNHRGTELTDQELINAANKVKIFENPALEDENLFRIGDTKRIGRQGKKITFTRANPTVTLNSLKKRLENEGVEYKVHKARTGSGYISFEREGIYYDLRSANHTRAYTSYNASDDTGGVELSFTREDGRIDGIDIDLSENEMGVNEIYSLMDEAARFNANDTGMFAVTERLVYPEEINGYEHIAAALGKKADDLIREREMALRAEYDRYKDNALQGYERPNLLPFKAGNGAVVEGENVRKVYFNGKPAFKRYATEALSEYFRERNRAMRDFEAAHAMSYDEWLASAHPEIRQEEDNMRDGTGALTDDEVSMENDPMSKLAGKSIRTRKQRQAFAERERRRMAAAVREMAERLHLEDVEIVTDASTLTGRRARAKGFYSPRTGKVTIVIPNHASEADAVQTLLHEAVAHKGLRQLFGEHFDTFLWNVYRNADRDVRERINALASEKGWDFPTATEEYLASLAENTDFENAQRSGWWEKIKRLFIDMLHKIGLDGFSGVTLSDNELRYILWRSYENLKEPGAERSITGVAADAVKQSELKVGNYAEEATGGDMAAERKPAMTEKQRRIEKLRRSEPVVATGEEYKGKYELNNKAAADYIIKSLKGEYMNKDTGVPIKITRKGAFKITRHDAENEAHLKSIALIPRLIENAVFVEEEPNSKANNGFDSYRYYVAGLNMAGADYTVKMAVGVKNGETYYDHSLTEIEKSNLINRIDEISSSFTDNKIAVSDIKDKRLVSILQTDEEENDEVLYRDGSAGEDGTRDTPLSSPTVHAWDRLAQSLKFQLRETAVDYLTAIDKFQDLIAKRSGRKIESFENAYDWMTFLSSRNRVEMDMFDSSVVRPLNNAILKLTGEKRKRSKWKWDEGALRELVMYVEAKHGTDRNRQMAVEEYVEELPEQDRERTMAAWTAEKKRINSQNISWIEKQMQLDAAAARIGADIEQDYSGLSSMFGDTDQYPGGWREASLLYAADYEAVHESADIASLWNAIDAATGFALRKQYETGLVSREYVDRQRERFEHYIPLRGFSDETAGDVYSYIGHDFYPGGNPVKTAHGRMSEAGNPFGSMLNIAYSSISAGNKNMAKTALYALVRNHDTDGLAMVNRAWMVRYDKLKEMPELSDVVTMPTFEAGEETPEWVEAVPRIPEAATSDDITRIMSKFEDVMTEYRKKDFTKPIRKNNTTAYRTLNKERSEHDIPLFIAGEKYVITVTGNPRPAQAMNGLLNPDVNEDALSELGKRVQRFMAGAFTGKNAAFSIANLFRDTIYANNQMFIRENPAYWLKFTRNQRLGFGDFIPMMRRLKKFREGTLGNSKDDRLFEEFMLNGGATGYTFVNTQEEYARELAGKLDELSRKTPEWFSPKGLIKLFFDAVQFAGESAELVNRFAAYKTSREMGRTMGRSIRDAKEITVNFNRKGAGRKSADKNKSWYSPVNMASAVSQYGRCSILFWNANMQGKYRFYKNMTEHPVKTSVTLIANNMALAAVVLPLLNNVALPMLYELMGLGDDGDDENYFNVLTDWERTHNICIRLPKSNWLKIPISPDFVSWFSMGDAIGGQVSGEREMSAKDFITAVIDAVSPLSMNWSYEGSQMLLNFAPTVTQPLLQNAMNVNFMGNPLKKTPYNSKQGFKPEYQMVYSSASPTLVELSRLSNRILGGTDLKTSGWADWNPAELQNLISGYTGGYGTTFLSAADWVVGTAKGEKQAVTFSRMPLVSRFAISGNKDVKLSRVNSRFYDVKNFVDEFEYDLKSYEDAIELAQKEKDAFKTAEYVAKREELIKSERAGRYQLLKGYVKAAKDCEDYLEELPEDEVTRNFLYNLKQEAINLLHGEYKKKE